MAEPEVQRSREYSFILGMIALFLAVALFILLSRNYDIGHTQQWGSFGVGGSYALLQPCDPTFPPTVQFAHCFDANALSFKYYNGTTWLPLGGGYLSGSTPALATTAGTNFFPISGQAAISASETPTMVGKVGIAHNFRCVIAAPPGGGTHTFTLRQNGNNSSITCPTMSGGTTSCSDTTDTTTMSTGTTFDVVDVTTGTPNAAWGSCGVEIDF